MSAIFLDEGVETSCRVSLLLVQLEPSLLPNPPLEEPLVIPCVLVGFKELSIPYKRAGLTSLEISR